MKLASFHSWADRRLSDHVDLPRSCWWPWPFKATLVDREIDGHAWGCGLR